MNSTNLKGKQKRHRHILFRVPTPPDDSDSRETQSSIWPLIEEERGGGAQAILFLARLITEGVVSGDGPHRRHRRFFNFSSISVIQCTLSFPELPVDLSSGGLHACPVHQIRHYMSYRYKERRWDPKQLIGSGGMPSSHSGTVTALAVAIGFQDGFGSSLFAVSMIFASVVMYDAFGVRLHAGKQAEVLNQIVYELPAEHPLAETRPLRELLGHTPSQVVAGAILGFFTAMTAYLVKLAAGQS